MVSYLTQLLKRIIILLINKPKHFVGIGEIWKEKKNIEKREVKGCIEKTRD